MLGCCVARVRVMCCCPRRKRARAAERPQSPVLTPDATPLQDVAKHRSSTATTLLASQADQGSVSASYGAPAGPLPSQRSSRTTSQTPSQRTSQTTSQTTAAADDWIAPPKGTPQHDWQSAVPDTALFPPPPPFYGGHDRSYTSNAHEEDAVAGEDWCRQYPLTKPLLLDSAGQEALQSGDISLFPPAGFHGKVTQLGRSRWELSTLRNNADSCLVGYRPLYAANQQDPRRTHRPKTIYYEVRLASQCKANCLALGFTALPYPPFRLPGWHRGSLAVHGDDGRKYINDRWGGQDFAEPFVPGSVYGLGMTFAAGARGPQVDIFFTRYGVKLGGWDLHAETDSEQDLPVTGLEGNFDVSCAVGAFGEVKAEVVFEAERWMYKGDC